MARTRSSLHSIKTLGQVLDGRRTRTPAGALLEMSVMANEKVRLTLELERGERRRADIEVRLAEIEAKNRRLLAFVRDPGAFAAVADDRESSKPRGQDEPRSPTAAPATGHFKMIEMEY